MYQHNGKFIDSRDGAYFDGSSYISVGTVLSSSSYTQATILFKMKLSSNFYGVSTGTSYVSTPISSRGSSSGDLFEIRTEHFVSSGLHSINPIYRDSAGTVKYIGSISGLESDKIYHVALTIDFDNDEFITYVISEGEVKTSTGNKGSLTSTYIPASGTLVLGNSKYSSNTYFNGYLADLKIIPAVLTKAEIVAEMKGDARTDYLLNMPLQSDYADTSDNAYTPTLTGSISYAEMQRGLQEYNGSSLPTEINELNVQTIKGLLLDGEGYTGSGSTGWGDAGTDIVTNHLNNATAFSLTAWYIHKDASLFFVSTGNGLADETVSGFWVRISSTGEVKLGVFDYVNPSYTSNFTLTHSSGIVADGFLRFFAISIDLDNFVFIIRIGGITTTYGFADLVVTNTPTYTLQESTLGCLVGGYRGVFGDYYSDGMIKDLKYFDVALTEEQIIAEIEGNETPTIAHWEFQEDFTDSSGNGYDITMSGNGRIGIYK